MSTHVRYTDKKGKEWTCTAEEWEQIQEREKKYKKRLFNYVGPFVPAKVEHIAPKPISKTVKMPEEVRTVRGNKKQGAADGPREQTSAN